MMRSNIKLVVISNDKVLCDFVESKGSESAPAKSIDALKQVIEQHASGYIIDEKSIMLAPNELAGLMQSYPEKRFFGLLSNKRSSLAKLDKLNNQLFQKTYIPLTRTKRFISSLLTEVQEEICLIQRADERVLRNMKAGFDISVTVTDDGIDVTFKDFNYRQTLSQDDLALPFLNFDGAPENTFDDVMGLDSAKQDFKLIINAMTNKEFFKTRNTSIPKGYVLSGYPGTGKTMLAKALAAECGLPFFHVNAADLLIGSVIENINKLFDVVEKNAPAILFLDEIDAIAQCRSEGSSLNQLAVNTLLVKLDGFKSTQYPVFTLAATNYPQRLDRALVRSGRLEKNIYCDLPGPDVRKEYIQKHLETSNCKISESELDEVTKMTGRCSIAILSQIIRESFYTESKTGTPWSIDMLIEEIRTAKFGDISSEMTQTKENIEATAYHEAGHLVAHKLLFPEAKVELASVQPRGAALGMIVPGEDSSNGSMSKRKIKYHLQVLLAGLAIETLQGHVGDDSLSGASNDRLKATNLAKNAITEWGMSEQFGLAIPSQFELAASDVATEVNSWLSEAFDDVTKLLKDNASLLTTVAKTLIDQETLNSNEIDALFTEFELSTELKMVG